MTAFKIISKICMQEFVVRICNSVAENILTRFSCTLKGIQIGPELCFNFSLRMFYGSIFMGDISQLISFCNTI
ncbi:hypothetical protein HZS_1889 [Henneguya salminicola]|nr:hypothetical protein HZS_1889 [Henneguya salminicola]